MVNRRSGRERGGTDRRAFLGGAAGFTFYLDAVRRARAEEPAPAASRPADDRRLIEITPADGVAVDLRYATSRNFLGRKIYDGDRLYLRPPAAEKLKRAVAILKATHPALKIVVFDGLRLNSAQKLLWEAVRGTAKEKFVANPLAGSIHSFGLAVDVSLLDEAGKALDMGTEFDDFTPLAMPALEAKFVADGRLTKAQVANRLLLRRVMQQAGFQTLAIEWWHFDALPPDYVRNRYARFE